MRLGSWQAARDAFEGALGQGDSADAWMGLAQAAWWLGDTKGSVDAAAHAFRLYRRADDTSSAVAAAVWLGLTYKSDYANTAAAAGWLGRAERLLTGHAAGAAARLGLDGPRLPQPGSRRCRGPHQSCGGGRAGRW